MTRTPPHDIDAERAVLGACMLSPDAAAYVAATLGADSWHSPAHGLIFAAIHGLVDALQPVDEMSVKSALKESGDLNRAGGSSAVLDLSGATPTAANVKHYTGIVRTLARRRRLIAAADQAAAAGYDLTRDIDEVEDAAASAITGATDQRTTGPTMARDLARAEITDAERRTKLDGVRGLSTGIKSVDKQLGGMRDGALIVLAARPAMGKTSLALNIASNAVLRQRVSTLIVSYEMTKEELFLRMCSARSHLDSKAVERMRLCTADSMKYHRAVVELADAPLAIDESSPSVMQIRAMARRHKQRHGLGLIVIDYLQMMDGSGGRNSSREGDVSEISRKLKSLAKELKVPILALSQLNRGVESRPNKRPLLSDLRESGAIEQDADVVMMLYREHYYDDRVDQTLAELAIAKQRHGPTGKVDLRWSARYCLFEDA